MEHCWKMLTFVILFLALLSGLDGGRDECGESPDLVCQSRYNINLSHLSSNRITEEQINSLCPVAEGYMQCLWDLKSLCSSREFKEQHQESFKQLMEVLHEACNQNSLLHKGIVSNIQCIADAAPNTDATCIQTAALALAAYEEDKKGCDEDDDAVFCLDQSKTFACMAYVVKNQCGLEAKDVLMTIGERLDWMFLMAPCADEDIRKIVSAVDTFQSEQIKSHSKRQMDVAIMGGAFGRK